MDKIVKFKKKITENNLNENLNCIVINPETNFYLSSEKVVKKVSEIYNLAKSINLKIKEIKTIKIRRIMPSFLFGKGQVENIKILLNRQFSKLLIVNSEVSPIQQRNLEKKLNLNLTKSRGCSSIFQPNYSFLKKFPDVLFFGLTFAKYLSLGFF